MRHLIDVLGLVYIQIVAVPYFLERLYSYGVKFSGLLHDYVLHLVVFTKIGKKFVSSSRFRRKDGMNLLYQLDVFRFYFHGSGQQGWQFHQQPLGF